MSELVLVLVSIRVICDTVPIRSDVDFIAHNMYDFLQTMTVLYLFNLVISIIADVRGFFGLQFLLKEHDTSEKIVVVITYLLIP